MNNRRDLAIDIREKYKEMKDLFVLEDIGKDEFVDRFLDIYEYIHDKVSVLLVGTMDDDKIFLNLDNLFERSINEAIDVIMSMDNSFDIEELGYTFFKSAKKSNNRVGVTNHNNNGFQVRDKFSIFKKVFNKVFFGNKSIKVKVYSENIEGLKSSKLPYYVILISGDNFERTFLINDQEGKATFVYDGLIKLYELQNAIRGEEVSGLKVKKIKYSKDRYSSRLEQALKNDFDFDLNDSFPNSDNFIGLNNISNKDLGLLSIVSDKKGETFLENVDFTRIKLGDFILLYFGYGTDFFISGNNLLIHNGGPRETTFKKVLSIYGIDRPDLPEIQIDYKNQDDIKTILSGDLYHIEGYNNFIKLEGEEYDLSKIQLSVFSKIYFGYGTKFGLISGSTLLKKYGGENNIVLKKILEIGGVKRLDLPSIDTKPKSLDDYKEILSSVTDCKGNEIVDGLNILNLVNLVDFRKMYFGYGTKFGMITGRSLLLGVGQNELIDLRKVLELGGINRPDLPLENIDFYNRVHIQLIFSNITDKDGSPIKNKPDIFNLNLTAFKKLGFGYGTKFGLIKGHRLLVKYGGDNLDSLKKILENLK